MRFAPLAVAVTVLGAASAHVATAQTGSIAGVVVAAQTGEPLGYSVVALPERNIERFTDDSGKFSLRDLPAGVVRLRIRHIGYSPEDLTVMVRSGETVDARAVLTRVAVTLAAVRVNGSGGCTTPGAPSIASDSTLGAIFGQLEQNAEQYRLISTRYPFTSVVERQFAYDPVLPATIFRPDTIPIASDAPWSYHPGEIVTRNGSLTGGYAVRIPTLAVFADPAFLDAHCFWSGGVVQVDSQRLLRVDFEAAERIHSPDLNGSMYLDTSSFVIRRSVIRLSRYSREIEDFDSISVDTHFDEALPGVPVIAAIDGRSHYVKPRDVRGHDEVASIEHQRIIALQFAKGLPGQAETSASSTRQSRRPVVLWLARVLGVFDAETGSPVAGVTVRDSTSGRAGVTSATGTVRLTFLPKSTGFLVLQKPGYASDTLSVRLSLADTTPITFVLRPTHTAIADSASHVPKRPRPAAERPVETTGPLAVLRVRVVAQGGAPLADANVVVREDSLGAVIVGRTDSSGAYDLAAPLDDRKDYTVVARKLGYAPASQDFKPRTGDTLSVALTLARNAELDTVRIVAAQLASKNYVLSGAEITRSTRGIFDALDAIAKLRPQMLGDRARECPVVKNIWVNGVRVWWQVPVPEEPHAPSVVHIPRSFVETGYEVVLQSIKPEHIAEMRYVNCWDTSLPEIGTNDALYVTLKPGITWDWKFGSHAAVIGGGLPP